MSRSPRSVADTANSDCGRKTVWVKLPICCRKSLQPQDPAQKHGNDLREERQGTQGWKRGGTQSHLEEIGGAKCLREPSSQHQNTTRASPLVTSSVSSSGLNLIQVCKNQGEECRGWVSGHTRAQERQRDRETERAPSKEEASPEYLHLLTGAFLPQTWDPPDQWSTPKCKSSAGADHRPPRWR